MKVYLATSALIKENWDWIKTMEAAIELGVPGVQLYINDYSIQKDYLDKALELIQKHKLEVLWHLPNIPETKHLEAYQYLTKRYESRGLIHYVPTRELPLKDANIGWENSISGKFDTQHVLETFDKSRQDNTFFVFDMTRIMYTDGDTTTKEEIYEFIVNTLSKLNSRDVIHVTGKDSWHLPSREALCIFAEGILEPIAHEILKFDGIIVPEYENFEVTVESIKKMKTMALS
jgi:hypothetical protein